MRRPYIVIIALALSCVAALAQGGGAKPAPTPTPQPAPAQPQQQGQPPRQGAFDLSEAGVQIRPEPRLIVMMAALDAAGFDPTPQGDEPSVFRAQVRKDQANLDADLRRRMASFYERNKLRDRAGKELPAAEQAARYVSLAYALGPAPSFEEPARSDDLPGGLLDVLDFAPLVREFYRRSGIDEHMTAYQRAYQAEGDRLRRPTVGMVRDVLGYLNTRPITTTIERVPVNTPSAPGKKDKPQQGFTTREHERRFVIVPDLLAAPGAINFRVIADDYFVTVPYCDDTRRYCAGRDNNPVSPELRRAYLRYVIDPIVVRFGREIAARREPLKQLLDARTAAGAEVSPDVFLTVTRSLVAAADVRMEEVIRLGALQMDARARLDKTTDTALRAQIVKELEAARTAVVDESTAQLADAYEGGAVLSFYFAEQLRGVESSGFDVTNSVADMLSSFDPAREGRRLAEADEARKRASAARKAREGQGVGREVSSLPNAALVKKLLDVDKLVQLKSYAAAEERLLSLLRESPGEARVFFALAEVANLWARDATDEDVQSERLNKALANYRNAVGASTPDTDRCMLVRAHEAMGRIYEFQERPDEALKEFGAALGGNDTTCPSYASALEGRKRLQQPK